MTKNNNQQSASGSEVCTFSVSFCFVCWLHLCLFLDALSVFFGLLSDGSLGHRASNLQKMNTLAREAEAVMRQGEQRTKHGGFGQQLRPEETGEIVETA